MHEDPAEVLRVLLNPVVLGLDFLLLEETQHVLLELPGALTGDDLDQRSLRPDCLVDDAAQRAVNVLPAVVDVVQIELELHACLRGARRQATRCQNKRAMGWERGSCPRCRWSRSRSGYCRRLQLRCSRGTRCATSPER